MARAKKATTEDVLRAKCEALEKRVAEAEKEKAIAEKRAKAAEAKQKRLESRIPKPDGQAGRGTGYNLQIQMGLPVDRYKRLLRLVKSYAMSKIDCHKTINKQDKTDILKLKKIITRDFPIFAEYRDAWPIQDILKQFLGNLGKSYARDKKAEDAETDLPDRVAISKKLEVDQSSGPSCRISHHKGKAKAQTDDDEDDTDEDEDGNGYQDKGDGNASNGEEQDDKEHEQEQEDPWDLAFEDFAMGFTSDGDGMEAPDGTSAVVKFGAMATAASHSPNHGKDTASSTQKPSISPVKAAPLPKNMDKNPVVGGPKPTQKIKVVNVAAAAVDGPTRSLTIQIKTKPAAKPATSLASTKHPWPVDTDFKALPERIHALYDDIFPLLNNEIVLGHSSPWAAFVGHVSDAEMTLTKFYAKSEKMRGTIVGQHMHCGYFGPLGFRIIKSTLREMFGNSDGSVELLASTLTDLAKNPLFSSSPKDKAFWGRSATAPNCITLGDFRDYVLLPHTATLLISKDMGITEAAAQKIRVESRSYGSSVNCDPGESTPAVKHRGRRDEPNAVAGPGPSTLAAKIVKKRKVVDDPGSDDDLASSGSGRLKRSKKNV